MRKHRYKNLCMGTCYTLEKPAHVAHLRERVPCTTFSSPYVSEKDLFDQRVLCTTFPKIYDLLAFLFSVNKQEIFVYNPQREEALNVVSLLEHARILLHPRCEHPNTSHVSLSYMSFSFFVYPNYKRVSYNNFIYDIFSPIEDRRTSCR